MFKLIGVDGGEYGPVSADQVTRWIAEGRVNGRTIAWKAGSQNWAPIATFPEFSAVLSASPPQPSNAPCAGPAKTNSMALAGFIFAILSITIGFCCCYGVPLNLLAVVFSLIGLSQIKADPSQQGRGLAIAGIVIGCFSLCSGLLMGLVYGLLMGARHIPGPVYHI